MLPVTPYPKGVFPLRARCPPSQLRPRARDTAFGRKDRRVILPARRGGAQIAFGGCRQVSLAGDDMPDLTCRDVEQLGHRDRQDREAPHLVQGHPEEGRVGSVENNLGQLGRLGRLDPDVETDLVLQRTAVAEEVLDHPDQPALPRLQPGLLEPLPPSAPPGTKANSSPSSRLASSAPSRTQSRATRTLNLWSPIGNLMSATTAYSESRKARSRASVEVFPRISIDSNSGGDTLAPDIATRTAPKATRGLSPRPSTSADRRAASTAPAFQGESVPSSPVPDPWSSRSPRARSAASRTAGAPASSVARASSEISSWSSPT